MFYSDLSETACGRGMDLQRDRQGVERIKDMAKRALEKEMPRRNSSLSDWLNNMPREGFNYGRD
jgi:hypothetical protein